MSIAIALCQVAVVAVILGIIAYDLRQGRPVESSGNLLVDPDWQDLHRIAYEENPAERSHAQTGLEAHPEA